SPRPGQRRIRIEGIGGLEPRLPKGDSIQHRAHDLHGRESPAPVEIQELGRIQMMHGGLGDHGILWRSGPLPQWVAVIAWSPIFESSWCEFQSGKPMFLCTLLFPLLTAVLIIAPASRLPAAMNSLTVDPVVEPEGLDPTIAAPPAIRAVTWLNI